jgi:flagellar hook-basal body complex protein FliE
VSAGGQVDGFGQSLINAVQSLDRLQQQADEGSMRLAAGEPVDLHDVMIAQEQASLSMQLAVQVRNKLVEAYQDVMRMQM